MNYVTTLTFQTAIQIISTLTSVNPKRLVGYAHRIQTRFFIPWKCIYQGLNEAAWNTTVITEKWLVYISAYNDDIPCSRSYLNDKSNSFWLATFWNRSFFFWLIARQINCIYKQTLDSSKAICLLYIIQEGHTYNLADNVS